jgi:hypothetical protein
MSWNLGLYLSESFAEISALSPHANEEPVSKLWYLRTKSLAEGLKEFFEQHNIGEGARLRVSSFWPEMIVQKNLGTPPALLVSAGFEDWLYLRQPKKTSPPAVPPERHRSFFSSDYIFGISERTDAEGKIQRRPPEEDLEFLHQKFLLSNTKNVAVGFLHSSKNPENENAVARFFRDRNYAVWASHEYGGGRNEVGRWWRAGLEAYVAGTLEEMNGPLVAFCRERGVLLESPDFGNLGGSFAAFNRLREYFKDRADHLLWADLRAFTLLDLNADQGVTETPWGPIAASTPRMKSLRLKPTSLIENEGLRGLRNHFFDIGFDPGPMALGRGVKPTLFDALHGFELLEVNDSIGACFHPGARERILQSLAITMRVLLKNESRWPEFLAGWARAQIVTDVMDFAKSGRILIAGPLASSLARLLGEKTAGFHLAVDPHSDWCASRAALETSRGK